MLPNRITYGDEKRAPRPAALSRGGGAPDSAALSGLPHAALPSEILTQRHCPVWCVLHFVYALVCQDSGELVSPLLNTVRLETKNRRLNFGLVFADFNWIFVRIGRQEQVQKKSSTSTLLCPASNTPNMYRRLVRGMVQNSSIAIHNAFRVNLASAPGIISWFILNLDIESVDPAHIRLGNETMSAASAVT